MNIVKTAVLGLALVAGPAFAESHATGDADAGEQVFAKCKACHSIVDADGKDVVKGGRTGPNLYGVYQRVAGTQEEFADKYGDSIKAAGEAGLEWNEEDFVVYVQDPRAFLQEYLDDRKARSKMSFKLRDEEDAKNVWAYLVSVGPDAEAEATN
ncbi:cytochrome C (plasmid) [Sulfitobacter alexandrii]|uniref:Cytochrome C n=1 Tax=Sulfitobacter alexandrii TaxID=1917485 RepID=A0A1J0WN62_9RHOB|nr:c-type cytochrome [Sulfitobacter alexandrii]APE45709.1 cytochrome C [Sulfitobacter alexandrii]